MWYCGIQLYIHFTFYSNVMLYIFFCQSLYLLNTILTHVYKCTIIVLYFIDEDYVWYKIPPLYEIIVNTTVFEQYVFLLIPLCIVVDFVWMNCNVNIHWNRVYSGMMNICVCNFIHVHYYVWEIEYFNIFSRMWCMK